MGNAGLKETNEERLIPAIRSKLAVTLHSRGYRIKDIARVLGTTPSAVTQYVNGKRGRGDWDEALLERLIEPFASRASARIETNAEKIEIAELLDVARQYMVMRDGRQVTVSTPESNETLNQLRSRLTLELSAAEKYLELANRARDDYTKLLLRMIASDSIKHGDIVSQMISIMQSGTATSFVIPEREILEGMLLLEDNAAEVVLAKAIRTDHPIARLLLEWIDADERKHENIVESIMAMKGTG